MNIDRKHAVYSNSIDSIVICFYAYLYRVVVELLAGKKNGNRYLPVPAQVECMILI